MTIVVEADRDMARRIEANLYKLVNVVSVEDITEVPNMIRDVALIKVTTTDEVRADLCRLAEDHRARVVDVGQDSMTFEISGRLSKIELLAEALRPYGILEMVQSGAIAMSRGSQSRLAAQRDAAAMAVERGAA